MNPKLEQFFNTLKSHRLSADEKNLAKRELMARLEITPASSVWLVIWQRVTIVRPMWVIATALIVVLAGGTGISAAAEGALPGDLFYPIKIKVKEPITRALVGRQEDKRADFETEILGKRLEEAERLFSSAKVEGKEQEEVAAKLTEQIKDEVGRQAAKALAETEKLKVKQAAVKAKEEPTEAESEQESMTRQPESKQDQNQTAEVEDKKEEKLDQLFEQHRELIEKLEIKLDNKNNPGQDKREVRTGPVNRQPNHGSAKRD